jgi:hypothetical protein
VETVQPSPFVPKATVNQMLEGANFREYTRKGWSHDDDIPAPTLLERLLGPLLVPTVIFLAAKICLRIVEHLTLLTWLLPKARAFFMAENLQSLRHFAPLLRVEEDPWERLDNACA